MTPNPPENDVQETQSNESRKRFVQLEEEGFPQYMIKAFVNTSKNTNTVICSRTPGKATTPLIADHHDLKSFQIKAKSCNWGPMAGFLCQLPFLNKVGAKKIDYNAGYTWDYLAGIARFSSTKKDIEKQVSNQKNPESAINDTQASDPEKSKVVALKAKVLKELKESAELKERMGWMDTLNKNEAKTGEWTGENNLPMDSPFIHLKRKFTGDNEKVRSTLETLEGILSAEGMENNLIYGTAQSKDGSVKIKYAIKKETDNKKEVANLWALYHGKITYQTVKENATCDVVSINIPEEVDSDKKAKFADKATNKEIDEAKAAAKTRMEKVFTFSEETIEIKGERYFAIRGFMNAFPPFLPEKISTGEEVKNNPDFYKNAVTGDYDLFALWPHVYGVGLQELERKTEMSIGKRLRMGGKIFTSFIGSNGDFAIEFIPGFDEINPDKDKGLEFSETADYGNIHDWGEFVAASLNSLSDDGTISGNKAFHSDEGGRPGIMEIEFPVAVFFPKELATKALNNADEKPVEVNDRTPLNTTSGIVKSPMEVVMLNLECQKAGYRVMMHSDWMMHLFFCSLTKTEQHDFINKTGEVYENCTKDNVNVIQDKIDKKLKEFKDIYDNDQKLKYEPKEYLRLIKILVLAKLESWKITGSYSDEDKKYPLYFINKITFDKDEELLFEQLRNTVLSFAFQPKRESIQKRRAFEEVLISKPRADYTEQRKPSAPSRLPGIIANKLPEGLPAGQHSASSLISPRTRRLQSSQKNELSNKVEMVRWLRKERNQS